jgi:hypothetical protein
VQNPKDSHLLIISETDAYQNKWLQYIQRMQTNRHQSSTGIQTNGVKQSWIPEEEVERPAVTRGFRNRKLRLILCTKWWCLCVLLTPRQSDIIKVFSRIIPCQNHG